MTDKEIIIRTLDFLKYKNGHSDILEHLADLDNETKSRIRLKLEDNNLATPHIYDSWKLMITSFGLKIKSSDLKEDGTLKRKPISNEWKKIIASTLIGFFAGGILSISTEWVKIRWLSEPPTNNIVLPSNLIIHDTIYVSDSLMKVPLR